MFEKIRNRISLDDLEVNIEANRLVFRCALSDEKQLNLAAGKIHRKAREDIACWSLSDSTLILRLPPGSKTVPLRDVHEAFKQIVS